MQRFQWVLMQVDIAKLGLFNKSNLTPLESVLTAELYDVFTVLSALQARQDFEEEKRLKNDSNRIK